MPKISVIVPVFNSEKYLNKTISAITTQSHTDLEIILIDAGSKDNSYKICEEFAEKDSRITLYKTENSGPSKTRNFGIEKASGDYIAFCDSDDVPSKDMYETLLRYLEDAGADVSFCDMFSERNGCNFGFPWEDGTVFNNSEVSSQIMAKMVGNLSDDDVDAPVWGSSVRCLFKKSIIIDNNVRFPEDIYFAEDLVFVLRYLSHANKAVICNKVLYFYTFNRSSIMNSFYSYKKDMFLSRRKLVLYIEEIILPFGLRDRLTVTERAYYQECVGNACRMAEGRTKKDIKNELTLILNDEAVKKAFKNYRTKNLKKKINYFLIKNRCSSLLRFYYKTRFK